MSANIAVFILVAWRITNFQNIITSFDQFFALSGSINYQSMRASLGAVDYEKGFQCDMYNNYVAETLFQESVKILILVYHYQLNTHLLG